MKYDGYFKLEAGLIFDLLMKLVLIFDVEKLRFKKIRFPKFFMDHSGIFFWNLMTVIGLMSGLQ